MRFHNICITTVTGLVMRMGEDIPEESEADKQEKREHLFQMELEAKRFSSLRKVKKNPIFYEIKLKRHIDRVIRSPCKYSNKLYPKINAICT